ncbi:sec24-related protein [Anaeramoeba ignava]|uniref:Sec24-related protein n=1 Tax=Anaeramoeba ignava TaxID=1746090 RepID=A0A9Q0LW94_ANAIG|nr:sec24-related protein [Anaeramoeba ignava]
MENSEKEALLPSKNNSKKEQDSNFLEDSQLIQQDGIDFIPSKFVNFDMEDELQIESNDEKEKLESSEVNFELDSITEKKKKPSLLNNFICQEEENSSPKFIRSTLYQIPSNTGFFQETQIPFGFVVHPFAKLEFNEEKLNRFEFSNLNELRCTHCSSFISPTCSISKEEWKCSICSTKNLISKKTKKELLELNFFHKVDDSIQVKKGSYEVVNGKADSEFMKNYVFVIEISEYFIENDILSNILKSIKEVISTFPEGSKITIITFDNQLQFYDFSRIEEIEEKIKENIQNQKIKENIQNENQNENQIENENIQNENQIKMENENIQNENIQNENIQNENLQNENIQNENQIEMENENIQNENENQIEMENENIQKENVKNENVFWPKSKKERQIQVTKDIVMEIDPDTDTPNYRFIKKSPKINIKSLKTFIVPDIDDIIVPISSKTLVPINGKQKEILLFLDLLPKIINRKKKPSVIAFGAAVKAASKLLENIGGRIITFHSWLSIYGEGELSHHEEIPTTKSQHQFYSDLANSCRENNISIDSFVFSKGIELEVEITSKLNILTNGNLYFFNSKINRFDYEQIVGDFRKLFPQFIVYKTESTLRLPSNLQVVDVIGSQVEKKAFSNTQILMNHRINEDDIFCFYVGYNSEILSNHVCFQFEMKYLSTKGDLISRIFNIQLSTSSKYLDFFESIDQETVATLIAKQSVIQSLKTSSEQIINFLLLKLFQVFVTYKKNCQLKNYGKKLIIPEYFQYLPLYYLGLMKIPLFRQIKPIGKDDEFYLRYFLLRISAKNLIYYLNPLLIPIHQFFDSENELKSNLDQEKESLIELPEQIGLYFDSLDVSQCYLFFDGFSIFIWIGRAISPKFYGKLLNIPILEYINLQKMKLPKLENHLSKKVFEIIHYLNKETIYTPQIGIMKRGDSFEFQLFSRLIEEKIFGFFSYSQLLKKIQKGLKEMEEETKEN